MRPVEFAPDTIIEAGKALQAAGRNITGFALRQKVGGGNPSRLRQVWDEHLASQSATTAEPVAELPVEVAEEVAAVTKALTERLAALAVELNDKAVKAAERRVHEVVRSAGEQRAQAERELSDAAQTVDDLEAKLDEVTNQAETLESKLADVQATSQAQAVELAQLRERLTVTEQSAKAAEAQHAQALKSATEQHVGELARMNAAVEVDRTRHQHEVDQLRYELLEQKKAFQAAAAERDLVRRELETARATADATEQAHRMQLESAVREGHQAAERIAKVEAALAQASREASTAREEAAKLLGQLQATQAQAVDLLRLVSQRAGEAQTPAAAPAADTKTPLSKDGK
jgi:chromosome segregation ATPase